MSFGEEQIVQAYSLATLGYYVDLPGGGVESVKELNGFTVSHGGETNMIGIYADRLSGEYSAVTVTPSAMVDVAILYLQAFENSDLAADGARVVIDGQKYSVAELKRYRVYKDDAISVYSVAPLVCKTSFEQQLDEYIAREADTPANSTWFLLEQYCNENISVWIKPMVLRIAAANSPSFLEYEIVISDVILNWLEELGMPKDGVRTRWGYYGRRWGAPYSEKLIRDYDMLGVRISDEYEDYEPMLFLQAFYWREFRRDDAWIWIDGEMMNPKDLEQYIIYSDNVLGVYDFTELICPVDFRERLSERLAAEGKDAAEFEWAFELESYVQQNKERLIQNMAEERNE